MATRSTSPINGRDNRSTPQSRQNSDTDPLSTLTELSHLERGREFLASSKNPACHIFAKLLRKVQADREKGTTTAAAHFGDCNAVLEAAGIFANIQEKNIPEEDTKLLSTLGLEDLALKKNEINNQEFLVIANDLKVQRDSQKGVVVTERSIGRSYIGADQRDFNRLGILVNSISNILLPNLPDELSAVAFQDISQGLFAGVSPTSIIRHYDNLHPSQNSRLNLIQNIDTEVLSYFSPDDSVVLEFLPQLTPLVRNESTVASESQPESSPYARMNPRAQQYRSRTISRIIQTPGSPWRLQVIWSSGMSSIRNGHDSQGYIEAIQGGYTEESGPDNPNLNAVTQQFTHFFQFRSQLPSGDPAPIARDSTWSAAIFAVRWDDAPADQVISRFGLTHPQDIADIHFCAQRPTQGPTGA